MVRTIWRSVRTNRTICPVLPGSISMRISSKPPGVPERHEVALRAHSWSILSPLLEKMQAPQGILRHAPGATELDGLDHVFRGRRLGGFLGRLRGLKGRRRLRRAGPLAAAAWGAAGSAAGGTDSKGFRFCGGRRLLRKRSARHRQSTPGLCPGRAACGNVIRTWFLSTLRLPEDAPKSASRFRSDSQIGAGCEVLILSRTAPTQQLRFPGLLKPAPGGRSGAAPENRGYIPRKSPNSRCPARWPGADGIA